MTFFTVSGGDEIQASTMDTDNNLAMRQSGQERGKQSPSSDQDHPSGSSALGRKSQDSSLGAVSDVPPSVSTPAKHQGPEPARSVNHSDDHNASDFSSRCTSDDVELQNISTEDEMTDDEEAGLNAQDKSHRRRRRKKYTQLDQRVIGVDQASKQEKSKADKNVLKALLINALLIASWYFFSLSISIVGKICL